MAKEAIKVITGLVRLSYAAISEPVSFKGGKPKFQSVLLIPKKDTKTVNAIKEGIKAAFKAGGFKNKETSYEMPLHDGDEKGDPNYEGCFYVNAKNMNRPGLLDSNKKALEPKSFYSGCYCYASINLYPFTEGKGGVAVGLNNLMKIKEGEPLSGGPSADEDFADTEIDPDHLEVDDISSLM